ncbi:MAG TPA: hypothetical protein VFT27_09040 [Actinomycetota bacterium]|nr:hypothetical protein [Actinomycetota bacterium]
MRRTSVAILTVAMLVIGAAGALALSSPGTHDEGPYVACVNSRTGAIRMVDLPVAGNPDCGPKEYSMAWGFPFEMEYAQDGTEVVDETYATQKVYCQDGQMPLGGGGSFSPDPDSASMYIETSSPFYDNPEAGPAGWSVEVSSPDGLPRTGTVFAYVLCTFANMRGWGD